ncbi:STM3941 family protein [Enterococcus sp. AZ163]|uniref:STM3941 family protein n=1 Tax=Enterococcus sp. AZ163 TaxID=2774638 RepID=UPI003D2D9B6C
MKEEYIVYQSKIKQIGLSFLGLLMVTVCLFVLLAGVVETQYLMIGIGLIGGLFFGACEIFILKQVFVGKKLVVLTSEGFYDYSSALATKDRLIPWSGIEKIENKSMAGQTFVSAYLKEPDPILSQLSTFQKKAISANVAMGFGEINVNLQSAKNCTNDDLLSRMNRYLDPSPAREFAETNQVSSN